MRLKGKISETGVQTEYGEARKVLHIDLGEIGEPAWRHISQRFYDNPAKGYEFVQVTGAMFREDNLKEELTESFPSEGGVWENLEELAVQEEFVKLEVA